MNEKPCFDYVCNFDWTKRKNMSIYFQYDMIDTILKTSPCSSASKLRYRDTQEWTTNIEKHSQKSKTIKLELSRKVLSTSFQVLLDDSISIKPES